MLTRQLLHWKPIFRCSNCTTGTVISLSLRRMLASANPKPKSTPDEVRSADSPPRPSKSTAVSEENLGKRKSSSSSPSPQPELFKWTPIYRFKYIVIARTIQRLKIWQTVFTCGGILPAALAANYYQLVPTTSSFSIYLAVGMATFACVMLGTMGVLASRIVGALYLHQDPERENELKVSRLSFFGNRVDKIVPRESFPHISDLTGDPTNLWVKLKYVGDKNDDAPPLYLSLRYGLIIDLDGFESVFGDMSALMKKPQQLVQQPSSKETRKQKSS